MPSTLNFALNLRKEDGDVLLKEDGDNILTEQHAYITIHDGIGKEELQAIEEVKLAAKKLKDAQFHDLALFANVHFGPDATGGAAEPTSVEITVKPGDVEIRRPL